jgi:hypothetical protein
LTDVVIITLPISMVLKLQIPMKQRLGVASMFALGIFVVIASIIRAYYSKLNETMLTCTVSMVETAVAIIAACLPALRQLILGHISRAGTYTNSAGRHHELSSRKPGNGTSQRQSYPGIVGGARKGHESDSVDELVEGGTSVSSGGMSADNRSRKSLQGIVVETGFEVFEEDDEGRKRRLHSEV